MTSCEAEMEFPWKLILISSKMTQLEGKTENRSHSITTLRLEIRNCPPVFTLLSDYPLFQATVAWTSRSPRCGEITSAPRSRTSWWRWRWWGRDWGRWRRSTAWPSTGRTGSPTALPTLLTRESSAGSTGQFSHNTTLHSSQGRLCPLRLRVSTAFK